MIRIADNGYVTINRGDTFSIPLFINIGTEMNPIRFYIKDHPGTKVYLGVMEPNQCFEKAIVRKMYTDQSEVNEEGDLLISFTPNDTMYLHPGRYYYQIKVLVDGKELNTIIPQTPFFIC